MRYCVRCNNWSHLHCLAGGVRAANVPWATDAQRLLPVQVGPARAAVVKLREWNSVVRHPIERRPRSDDGFRHQPFTVEALLQHLRLHATHAMQANPAQQLQRVKSFANAWIEATYVDPNARRHVKKALKEIVNEEKDVFWYTCRRCGLWI